MKKIFLITSLVCLVIIGCGDKKKEETNEVKTATEEVKKPEAKEKEPANNDVVIEADDNMRFNKKRIVVNGGQKVKITLKHTGQMAVDLMGHNLVILKKGTNLNEFGQKANAAKDTEYIPADMKDAVIVHTKMIGGGEETTIEFDAPEAGEYDFLCSFPAHYAIMKGKFVVQ
ncbi:MAG: azurin [Flavobacteriaceae bacterium]|nr:azurin [Flavobacteriaceae bacterium]